MVFSDFYFLEDHFKRYFRAKKNGADFCKNLQPHCLKAPSFFFFSLKGAFFCALFSPSFFFILALLPNTPISE